LELTFSGKSIRPVIFAINFQKQKPAFKICILLNAMCCENFGNFYQRKFKKITNKAIKTAKKHIWEFKFQD